MLELNPNGTIIPFMFGGGANSAATETLGDVGHLLLGLRRQSALREDVRDRPHRLQALVRPGQRAADHRRQGQQHRHLRHVQGHLRRPARPRRPGGRKPLYTVIGRGGPNLVKGMFYAKDILDTLRLPYKMFGYDTSMIRCSNTPRRSTSGGARRGAGAYREPNETQVRSLGGIHETAEDQTVPLLRGLHSLEELVTREYRVCVINILGSESRKVTPVSHEYSGGNIVAGVAVRPPGRARDEARRHPGLQQRPRRDGRRASRSTSASSTCRPSASSQAVSELVTNQQGAQAHRHRHRKGAGARFAQHPGDLPGGRRRRHRRELPRRGQCLGSRARRRRLGGDHPEETLRKGSVAIHSNSGNFTTTIAEYLRTAGFGITTAVQLGKDVYIHFALPEFLYAAQNDPRTKAVVLYVEPGGYYEKMALDWIRSGRSASPSRSSSA